MSYFLWMLKLALFLLVLIFAIRNTDPVTVRFVGGEWQSPLIFVLLAVFCVGIALGLAAGLAHMFRQRREIATLERKLRDAVAREPGIAEKDAKPL